MTEINAMAKAFPEINEVVGFDPAAFARTLVNDDGTKSLYLDVKYRLLWFRLAHPNGKIDPEIVRSDERSAVVCCRIYADKTDPADQFIGKATAQRYLSEEKYGDRFLEIAETAALGRALASAGFGTQFCGNIDLVGDPVVDAPVDAFPDDAQETSAEPMAVVITPKAESDPMPKPVVNTPTVQTTYSEPKTVEEWISSLSVEDAKAVVVDVGRYSGTTLGEIAMHHPGDLDWYVRNYAGRNLKLKAGATVLRNAALERAS
jgi:hypothetical protein